MPLGVVREPQIHKKYGVMIHVTVFSQIYTTVLDIETTRIKPDQVDFSMELTCIQGQRNVVCKKINGVSIYINISFKLC